MLTIKWDPSIADVVSQFGVDLDTATQALADDLSAQDAASQEHDKQRVAALLNVLEHYALLLPSSTLLDRSSVEKEFRSAVQTQDPTTRIPLLEELATRQGEAFQAILKAADINPEELQRDVMLALNPLRCAPFTSVGPFAAGRTVAASIVQE